MTGITIKAALLFPGPMSYNTGTDSGNLVHELHCIIKFEICFRYVYLFCCFYTNLIRQQQYTQAYWKQIWNRNQIFHIPQMQQFLNHNDKSINLINTGILMAVLSVGQSVGNINGHGPTYKWTCIVHFSQTAVGFFSNSHEVWSSFIFMMSSDQQKCI